MPDERFLGTRNSAVEGRPYEWKTYKEANVIIQNFTKGKYKYSC